MIKIISKTSHLLNNRPQTIEPPIPLEEALRTETRPETMDLEPGSVFKDYLAPNEINVLLREIEFDRCTQLGLIVSTGTERSFFLLALSNPERCTGLVVRDINPRVKAYVDFNTLLLRLAETMRDYQTLSQLIPNPVTSEQLAYCHRRKSYDSALKDILRWNVSKALQQKIALIFNRLQADRAIPTEMKAYYVTYLDNFAEIYYKTDDYWKIQTGFLHYHKEEQRFSQLQSYAKNGNIIATIGDIGDLHFLQDFPITLVDSSNIWYYSLIDMRLPHSDTPPRMLWTQFIGQAIRYHSCPFSRSLFEDEKKEMNQLMDILFHDYGPPIAKIRELGESILRAPHSFLPAYNLDTLQWLRQYKHPELLHLPHINKIMFNKQRFLGDPRFGTLTKNQWSDLLCEPELPRFVNHLVQSWCPGCVPTHVYQAFSTLPGWVEAFEKEAQTQRESPCFLFYCSQLPPPLKEIANKITQCTKEKLTTWMAAYPNPRCLHQISDPAS